MHSKMAYGETFFASLTRSAPNLLHFPTHPKYALEQLLLFIMVRVE